MRKQGIRAPLVQGRDIGMLMILALLAMGTLLPERQWPAFARRIARWRVGRRGPLGDAELAVIRGLVGNQPSDWIETHYLPDWLGHRYLAWLRILACYPPRSWHPPAVFEGACHLDAALARGRGAILWTATFAHNDLFTKAALAEAGHRAHLLTWPTHGFSASRFGRRFLNPVYLHVEQRFMGDNIVIDDEGTAGAVAEVKRRLARNEIVIIYVVPIGRRLATRPFLNGEINIATGALNLACDTGAAVLPVFTSARPDGRVVTALTEALPMTRDGERALAIERMLEVYLPELEARVHACPEQFAYPLAPTDGQMLIEASSSDAVSAGAQQHPPATPLRRLDPALNIAAAIHDHGQRPHPTMPPP